MVGVFLCLLLTAWACQENTPSTSEHNPLQVGNDATAERVLIQALREAEAGGQSDVNLAEALHAIGEWYRIRGNLTEAESYFWRALPVWAASAGAMDPRMATSLSSLALVFETRKEYTKAVPLVEQALKIREEAFGVEHPEIVPTLERYADLLRLSNRIEKAEQIDARLARIPAPY